MNLDTKNVAFRTPITFCIRCYIELYIILFVASKIVLFWLQMNRIMNFELLNTSCHKLFIPNYNKHNTKDIKPVYQSHQLEHILL